MAGKSKRPPSSAAIKAAADRAELRAKGVDPLDAVEVPAHMRKPEKRKRKPRGEAEAVAAPEHKAEFKLPVIGRPTLYREDMCQRVVELGAEGKSKAQIARALAVSRQTMNEWQKAHPRFADAVKVAEDLALAWWEDQGALGMHNGKGFNATAFIFQVKNRFRADYMDTVRNELTGKDGEPIEVADARSALFGRINRLADRARAT